MIGLLKRTWQKWATWKEEIAAAVEILLGFFGAWQNSKSPWYLLIPAAWTWDSSFWLVRLFVHLLFLLCLVGVLSRLYYYFKRPLLFSPRFLYLPFPVWFGMCIFLFVVWIWPGLQWSAQNWNKQTFVVVVTNGQNQIAPSDPFYGVLERLRQGLNVCEDSSQGIPDCNIRVEIETKDIPQNWNDFVQDRLETMRSNRGLAGAIWFQYNRQNGQDPKSISPVIIHQTPRAGTDDWKFAATMDEGGLESRIRESVLLYITLVEGRQLDDGNLLGRTQLLWEVLNNRLGIPWTDVPEGINPLSEIVALDPKYFAVLLDAIFRLNQSALLQRNVYFGGKSSSLGELASRQLVALERKSGLDWNDPDIDSKVEAIARAPELGFYEILLGRLSLSLGNLEEAQKHVELLQRVRMSTPDTNPEATIPAGRKVSAPLTHTAAPIRNNQDENNWRELAEMDQLVGDYYLYLRGDLAQARTFFTQSTDDYSRSKIRSVKPFIGLGQTYLRDNKEPDPRVRGQLAARVFDRAVQLINAKPSLIQDPCSDRADTYYWLSLADSLEGLTSDAQVALQQGRQFDKQECQSGRSAVLFEEPLVLNPLSMADLSSAAPTMRVKVAIFDPVTNTQYKVSLEDPDAQGGSRTVTFGELKSCGLNEFCANLDLSGAVGRVQEYGKWFSLKVDQAPNGLLPLRSMPLRLTGEENPNIAIQFEAKLVTSGNPIKMLAHMMINGHALEGAAELWDLNVLIVYPGGRSNEIPMKATDNQGEFAAEFANTQLEGSYSVKVTAKNKNTGEEISEKGTVEVVYPTVVPSPTPTITQTLTPTATDSATATPTVTVRPKVTATPTLTPTPTPCGCGCGPLYLAPNLQEPHNGASQTRPIVTFSWTSVGVTPADKNAYLLRIWKRDQPRLFPIAPVKALTVSVNLSTFDGGEWFWDVAVVCIDSGKDPVVISDEQGAPFKFDLNLPHK